MTRGQVIRLLGRGGVRLRGGDRVEFDTSEDDACPECVEMAQLWVDDRPAFDARIQERESHRRKKVYQRWEAEQAELAYAEFLRRQDVALREGKASPVAQDEDDDDSAL